MSQKTSAVMALLLLAPVQVLGTSVTMVLFPDSDVAKLLFFVAKAVMLAAPLVWVAKVDGQQLALPRLSGKGMGAAVASGSIMIAVIAAAYYTVGHAWIDMSAMRDKIAQMQLDRLGTYLAGAVYWCTVNSLLEEYFWRWFIFTRCEALMRRHLAVVVSALLFTLHHVVALNVYFDWRVTAVGSLGVFLASTTWSWIYLKYRNIYAAYVSHVFADVVIFWIGYRLIF